MAGDDKLAATLSRPGHVQAGDDELALESQADLFFDAAAKAVAISSAPHGELRRAARD